MTIKMEELTKSTVSIDIDAICEAFNNANFSCIKGLWPLDFEKDKICDHAIVAAIPPMLTVKEIAELLCEMENLLPFEILMTENVGAHERELRKIVLEELENGNERLAEQMMAAGSYEEAQNIRDAAFAEARKPVI